MFCGKKYQFIGITLYYELYPFYNDKLRWKWDETELETLQLICLMAFNENVSSGLLTFKEFHNFGASSALKVFRVAQLFMNFKRRTCQNFFRFALPLAVISFRATEGIKLVGVLQLDSRVSLCKRRDFTNHRNNFSLVKSKWCQTSSQNVTCNK